MRWAWGETSGHGFVARQMNMKSQIHRLWLIDEANEKERIAKLEDDLLDDIDPFGQE